MALRTVRHSLHPNGPKQALKSPLLQPASEANNASGSFDGFPHKSPVMGIKTILVELPEKFEPFHPQELFGWLSFWTWEEPSFVANFRKRDSEPPRTNLLIPLHYHPDQKEPHPLQRLLTPHLFQVW